MKMDNFSKNVEIMGDFYLELVGLSIIYMCSFLEIFVYKLILVKIEKYINLKKSRAIFKKAEISLIKAELSF